MLDHVSVVFSYATAIVLNLKTQSVNIYIPVGTQRCDNVVTTSQIGCDVIQPKPDLHTTLIDVDNFIGCVPTDILRCIDVEIKSLVFIILRTKILISIQIKHHHSHILIVIMCNNVFCSNEN